MTPWEIALRFFFGWILVMAGGALYLIARWYEENGENVSWADWAVNIVIGIIGLGILIAADRVLRWTSLPDVVRWITIGLFLGAAIICYVRVLRGAEGLKDNQVIILYLSMFGLLSLGLRLALAEFGVELP